MKVLFTRAKLEGWALVAEIGGAVAVIMSVIYLGRQINDQYQAAPQPGPLLQDTRANEARLRALLE